jgi:hypothetical protein
MVQAKQLTAIPASNLKLEDLDLMFATVDHLIKERKASGEEGAKIHDLLNALYFLINHPAVLAKVYEEVDRVLGRDLQTPPTYQQGHALQYISQILKETLRLCPPVTLLQRHAYKDRVQRQRDEAVHRLFKARSAEKSLCPG